jgi:phage-related protein
MLRRLGHRMRRPEADYIGDRIYELRFARSGLRYRILYGYHGRELVLLLSAFVKTVRRVPTREMRIARRRFDRYLEDPARHSYLADHI